MYNTDRFVYRIVDTEWDNEVTGREFARQQVSNLLLHVEDEIFPPFADFGAVEEEEGVNNGRMVILTMILVKQNQEFHE